MLTPNDWNFWIIVWIYEFAILTVVILRNRGQKPIKSRLTVIGLSLIVFGTYFYLIFTIAIFSLDEYTTICMFAQLDADSIDKDKLWKCYNDGSALKWNYFTASVIMTMVIVFGTVLQEFSRRN